MGKYKNEEYLKERIMGQSRHLFIYGFSSDDRSKFLQNLEEDYPVTDDLSSPIALYFNSLGLPQIDNDLEDRDNYIIYRMCREYLSFLVATRILEKSNYFDETILNNKLSLLIHLINKGIVSVSELLDEMKKSRDFYYDSYIKYTKGLIKEISINEINVPFLNLEMFVSRYKRCMNMQSYFGIIYDKRDRVSVQSIQTINNFIGARINNDISIKIATNSNEWETYYNTNGQYVEAIHDYGIIELDDLEDTKKLIKHI